MQFAARESQASAAIFMVVPGTGGAAAPQKGLTMCADYTSVSTAQWRQWYVEKEEILDFTYGEAVSRRQFYSELFPPGSLQPFNPMVEEPDGTQHRAQRWKDARAFGRGNVIVWKEEVRLKDGVEQRRRKRFLMMDERWDDINPFLRGTGGWQLEKSFVSPVSYFGWKMDNKHAHQLFAIVLDIDYVAPEMLQNLLNQFRESSITGRIEPSYLVNSGRGLHAWFLLREPLHLYHNSKPVLTELKNRLADFYWNETTSMRPDKVDHGSIIQDFRAVGSRTKIDILPWRAENEEEETEMVFGTDYRVRAYKCSDRRFSVYELNEILAPKDRLNLDVLYERPDGNLYPTMPLEKAKDVYEAWYAELIAEYGSEAAIPKPGTKKYQERQSKLQHRKNEFVMPRSVYDRFKAQAKAEAWVGGRYHIIRTLCSIGIKCSDYHPTRNPEPVTDEEIIADAWELYEFFSAMAVSYSDAFLRSDVEAALEILRPENRELGRKSTREWIESKTKILFPPAIKRNGLKREYHLEDCREKKEKMKRRGQSFKNPEGRPEKKCFVEEWQREHPDGTKAQCIKDTGLSKPTVYKWWKE